MAQKRWSDLSPLQRRGVVAGGALESVLTLAAVRDLARRRPDQVRGPKPVWALSFVVQPFGPLAYFLLGRR
jgi:hypothetical protein